ncbi:hypothetical protein LINGRAHAP2_LOCUS22014 [Linum grandiflorum]
MYASVSSVGSHCPTTSRPPRMNVGRLGSSDVRKIPIAISHLNFVIAFTDPIILILKNLQMGLSVPFPSGYSLYLLMWHDNSIFLHTWTADCVFHLDTTQLSFCCVLHCVFMIMSSNLRHCMCVRTYNRRLDRVILPLCFVRKKLRKAERRR